MLTATLADSAAVTASLVGKVNLTLTDTVVGTVSVLGATDNSNVTVSLNHNALLGNSIITLGNGNDTITLVDSATSTATITVGSGTDGITLSATHGVENIIFSAANGASQTVPTTVTNDLAGGTFTWATNAINNAITHEGAVLTIAAGVSGAVSTNGYSDFTTGGNTYIYENTGTLATSELVAIVGAHTLASATIAVGTIA